MPVLKDVRCIKCSHVIEAMMEGADTGVILLCRPCGTKTVHQSLCSGGIKTRYRFCDWDGFDPEGYVEYMGVKAGTPQAQNIGTSKESKDVEPWADVKTGSVYHEASRYQKDAIAERRKERKAKKAIKEGRAPLHFS